MSSLFIVRGRLADIEDLERCCRRAKALPPTDFDEYEIAILPVGIECVILRDRIASISDPENFKQLQCFLHYSAVYIDSCFDRGLWLPGSDDKDPMQYPAAAKHHPQLCFDNLHHAGFCLGSGQGQLGGAYARSAFEHLPNVLRCNHQDVMANLLIRLRCLQEKGLQNFLHVLVRYLAELVAELLPPFHPHKMFFAALQHLTVVSIDCLYEVHIAQRRSLYVGRLGVNHLHVVRIDYSSSRGHDLTAVPSKEIQAAVERADHTYGAYSRRAFLVLRSYCYRLYEGKRWSEAAVLFEQLAHRAENANCSDAWASAKFCQGKSHLKQLKFEDAKNCWLEVLHLADCDSDMWKYWLNRVLDDLAMTCHHLGEHEEAKRYRVELADHRNAVIEADEERLRNDGITIPNRPAKFLTGSSMGS